MKKEIIDALKMLLAFVLGICIGLNLYNPYDANRDGNVNPQDYVLIKNYIKKGCN